MTELFKENINFAKEENATLEFWKKIKAFETCLEQSKYKKKYSFYDGPPFATGLPHYGHLLTSSLKDTVTRFAHQTNHHVERRFGWDCHGVPVEYEIDKRLKIQGPADVLKMGIAEYNKECRSIVMMYSAEWREVVTRIGRWIDFDNDYKTMYPWFMESVWYVFKQIFEKGLVYRGVKVMPYSTACSTPLSNFEAKQNYKDVSDPTVIVTFPLCEDPSTAFIAWTTTPWTLPSNLALCVNPNMDYVKVKDVKTGNQYILMESRIGYVFKSNKVEILERMKGKDLEFKEYIPLFDYYIKMKSETGAFKVMCDNYVTEASGTGIVHQAPYFGEDDFRVCLANGIITKSGTIVCPVDECGKFTSEVTHFAGVYVKEADKQIIQHLKEAKRLVSHGTEKHSYPFCWRSDTPLLNKAIPSWFIRVEDVVDKLLEANSHTYWVPDFVKESRFTNWLRDARDWAISRNRFWGTPIPLWVSDDYEEVVCVGSIDELRRLSGVEVQDLHREYIDDIVIPSKMNKGVLRRVPEVFDCWFESGSMPYAQLHFPFSTSKKQFEEVFPADFIAEGIDQTRGWFYTLTVISTILFGKSPFKNLVVNGIVLASDGQKMSKRLKNYPDPKEVIENYGADAVRLYMISSPIVRGQNLRFMESGVRDIVKDVFIPWYNSLKFLFQSSLLPYERKRNNGHPLMFKPNQAPQTTNMMDMWIISFTQSLIKFFFTQMEEYRLDTVVPRLIKFVDQLTNWYVRMNRKRLRGENVLSDQDWYSAIATLFLVLYQMTVMMSPFVPFITEFFYQKLKTRLDFSDETDLKIGVDENKCPDSIHYIMIPKHDNSLIRPEIEESVSLMQAVVEMGRKIRDQKTLALKSPLMEVVVVSQDLNRINRLRDVESYVLEELNVRLMTISNDKQKYNVELKAELNHRILGSKLKKDYQAVLKESKNLTTGQLESFQSTQKISILGYELGPEDLEVVATVNNEKTTNINTQYESLSNAEGILVLMDCNQSDELLKEGVAREIINRIQRRRKELNLVPEDPVTIYCWADNEIVRDIFTSHRDMIHRVILQPITVANIGENKNSPSIIPECSILSDSCGTVSDLKECPLQMWFAHDHSRLQDKNRKCVPTEGHADIGRTVEVICDSLGSLKIDLNGIDCIDVLKRHIRISFGWSKFGADQIIILEENGDEMSSAKLSTFKGLKLFVKG